MKTLPYSTILPRRPSTVKPWSKPNHSGTASAARRLPPRRRFRPLPQFRASEDGGSKGGHLLGGAPGAESATRPTEFSSYPRIFPRSEAPQRLPSPRRSRPLPHSRASAYGGSKGGHPPWRGSRGEESLAGARGQRPRRRVSHPIQRVFDPHRIPTPPATPVPHPP